MTTSVVSELIELNNWSFGYVNGSTSPRLSGQCKGHSQFPDNTEISPSPAIAIDPIEPVFKSSSGRIYMLGEPSGEYKAIYPNAKDEILKKMRDCLPNIAFAEM